MQAHLFISGSVQGVGYRQFVKSRAKKLGLTGWTRNLPDGRVEAVVQGEKDSIEKLITECQKGPFLAAVEKIGRADERIGEKMIDFTILPTPTEF